MLPCQRCADVVFCSLLQLWKEPTGHVDTVCRHLPFECDVGTVGQVPAPFLIVFPKRPGRGSQQVDLPQVFPLVVGRAATNQ